MRNVSGFLATALYLSFSVFLTGCGSYGSESKAGAEANYQVSAKLDMDQRKAVRTTTYWSNFTDRDLSLSIADGDSVIAKPFSGLISGDIEIVKLSENQFHLTFTNTSWGNNSTVIQTVGAEFVYGEFTTGTYSDGRIRIGAQIQAQ